jgi:GTPase SAR1 family protein
MGHCKSHNLRLAKNHSKVLLVRTIEGLQALFWFMTLLGKGSDASRDTFNHLTRWLEEVRESGNPDMTIMIVGNKCDLDERRQVSYEEGERFAKENDLIFIETSAKTSHNVDEAFVETSKEIYANIDKGLYDLSNEKSGIRVGNEGF